MLLAIGLSACGASSGDAPARVAESPITAAAVDHWLTVIDGTPAATSSKAQQSSQRRAMLSFLIFSRWILGEAAAKGVRVTDDEAQARLELVGGEQSEAPASTGLPGEQLLPTLLAKARNHADRLWLVKLSVLAARLEARTLSELERQVTPTQIAAYYRAHPSRYMLPEKRDVEWIVTFDRRLLAKALAEIRAGKSFVGVAKRVSLDKPTIKGMERHPPVERSLARRVFVAKPHVLIGPITEEVDHYVFEVTRVIPSRRRTLAEAEGAIRTRLAQPPALAAFVSMIERKWSAKTSCRAADLTDGCAGGLGADSQGASTGGSRVMSD